MSPIADCVIATFCRSVYNFIEFYLSKKIVLTNLFPRPAKSRNHAISDWGHKDIPSDTFWLAGIYFLGPVTFEFLLGFESMILM